MASKDEVVRKSPALCVPVQLRVVPPNKANTMKKIFNTITQISVGREDENPVFGECIHIKLEDEAGGMFLVMEQDGFDDKSNEIRIGFEEWDNICLAVSTLMNQKLVK